MKTIILKPLFHRGKEVIALCYLPDALLNNAVKQVAEVRWSQTHTCWYIPCTRYFVECVSQATRHIARLDNQLLKEYLLQKQALVTDMARPLHQATVNIIKQFPLNTCNLKALTSYRN